MSQIDLGNGNASQKKEVNLLKEVLSVFKVVFAR